MALIVTYSVKRINMSDTRLPATSRLVSVDLLRGCAALGVVVTLDASWLASFF